MAITPTQMATKLGQELHDTALSTYVYDWINTTQEDMDSRCFWNCLEATPPYVFKLSAPYETGTITVTNGSATVTGLGTSWSSGMVGQILALEDANEYYYIQAVGGVTAITLSSNYIGTSAATQNYSIYYITYALPTAISLPKIKSFNIQDPAIKLRYLDQAERDELDPGYPMSVGQPTRYLDWGGTSVQPWPLPDQDYQAVIHYQKQPTAVDSGSSSFDWPAQMHWCLLKGALARGWKFKDDLAAYNAAQAEYEALLQQHIMANNRRGDSSVVLRRFDEPSTPQGLMLGRHITP